MTRRARLGVIIALFICVLLGASAAWQLYPQPLEQTRAGPNEVVLPAGTGIGGPFALVNQEGQAVTDRDYRGRFTLIYFGYSFCPDVCPTELGTMAAALDLLTPAESDRVQPMFITVDPQRDTPAHLKTYVPLFHPRLVGLTGTPEQTRAVLSVFRVYAAKLAAADPDAYLMDHSSFFYLLAPDGQLQTLYRGGLSPEELAGNLRRRMGQGGGAVRAS